MNEDTALVEREEQALTTADPQAFAHAFDAYKQIQEVIDARMPKEIMRIGDKMFRKKAYWRAVATAFNVDCTMHAEEHFEAGDDWGYRVVYTARSKDGRSASGDGVCMASEKSKGRMEATHHNVRGHAHTRAFNRAISNLVGFGEVSADELPDEEKQERKQTATSTKSSGSSKGWDGNLKVKSGKYAGQKWSELPTGFLEWALKQDGAIKDMAAKEIGRRSLEQPPEPEQPPFPEEEGPF